MPGYIIFVEDEDFRAREMDQMIQNIIQDYAPHQQNQIIVQRLHNVDELKKMHAELPFESKIIFIFDLLMEGDNQPKHRIDADVAYIIQQRISYSYFIIYSIFMFPYYSTELQNVINKITDFGIYDRVIQLDRSQELTLKEYIIKFIQEIE